jgi:hypothetical protein
MADVSELQIKLGIKRIKTPVDVRDEMERVYRAMARKQIESADGARMINALSMLLNTMDRASYQDVVDAAEELFQQRG